MTAMLNVKDLRAYYGQVQALHGLSFSLNEGSLTTLLGANGAGKTTTLRAIRNMVRSTGAIELEGKALSGRSTENVVRLGIAHVPQGRGTFTTMTVEENLQLGAITHSDKKGVVADIERMYEHFPVLKQRHTQQAGTLSGGEQQMLAVARALMLRPRLMLLDEPSFGLAPLIVRELFKILGKINREDKVTILVVEQNAQLALELADQAYVIETGKIVMSGNAKDIATNEDVRTISATEEQDNGTVYQPSPGRDRHGRDLCLYGARRRDDLPGDRPSQFRPGRNGDVLDLHFLATDAVGHSLLVGLPGHADHLLWRRHPDRAAAVQAARQGADPDQRRGFHRVICDRQLGGRLDLGLHHQAVSVAVRVLALPRQPADLDAPGRHVIGVTLLLLVALYFFFQFTRIGLAMRAAASLPESARLVGINTSWMIALGWGMASAIGAIAGILIAPVVFLEPNMMGGVLIYGFAAAVLGGLTSPLGAVIGGFLVGVFENLAGTYIPGVGNELKLPIASLALIITVLVVKPAGLLGRPIVKRV
jgi:branched-chain amino acid transport system ATP-binding protein